ICSTRFRFALAPGGQAEVRPDDPAGGTRVSAASWPQGPLQAPPCGPSPGRRRPIEPTAPGPIRRGTVAMMEPHATVNGRDDRLDDPDGISVERITRRYGGMMDGVYQCYASCFPIRDEREPKRKFR